MECVLRNERFSARSSYGVVGTPLCLFSTCHALNQFGFGCSKVGTEVLQAAPQGRYLDMTEGRTRTPSPTQQFSGPSSSADTHLVVAAALLAGRAVLLEHSVRETQEALHQLLVRLALLVLEDGLHAVLVVAHRPARFCLQRADTLPALSCIYTRQAENTRPSKAPCVPVTLSRHSANFGKEATAVALGSSRKLARKACFFTSAVSHEIILAIRLRSPPVALLFCALLFF